jgi:hypothetical protein
MSFILNKVLPTTDFLVINCSRGNRAGIAGGREEKMTDKRRIKTNKNAAEHSETTKSGSEPPKRRENDDEQAALRTAYQEVCNSYHAIDDVRIGLLGRLPLVSGVGIAVLLNPAWLAFDIDIRFYVLIGAFGFVVSLGLLLYEVRGVQQCAYLIALGRDIENSISLKRRGQFTNRPDELLGIGKTSAARFIYPIVLAAWMYVIFYYLFYCCWTFEARFWGAAVVALFVLVVGSIAITRLTKRFRRDYNIETSRTSGFREDPFSAAR